ncbi:MAG: hypothetical protein IKZ59_02895 [Clostridia bacterium]|nr:hypothetical protein [Clostridia bacterium]
MIKLDGVILPLDTDFNNLKDEISKTVEPKDSIVSARLYRKSVDARKKGKPQFCCSVILDVKDEIEFLRMNKTANPFSLSPYIFKKAKEIPKNRPVVVGFGPAGMFASLTLARAGLCPLVIERGPDVDTRTADVGEFFSGGALKENSNIQFGEGGAGTFSDGKLNTGIKDFRVRTVLETFAEFGADGEILYDAKPHIGTDVLRDVVKNIRKEIISLGGEVRFNTCLEEILTFGGNVVGIIASGEEIKTENLFLCIGHSARDTFTALNNGGFLMCRKPFAVGVRIEHLQSDIDRALYGNAAGNKNLGAADYKLAVHLPSGRGVYTFCMCPGGVVVNASSERAGVVCNGMSYKARDGVNANSAVLVGVASEDIEGDGVLAGIEFQRKIEQSAYRACGGKMPVCNVGYFLGKTENGIGKVKPTVKPGYGLYDVGKLFPGFITDSLKSGIELMNRKLSGFADNEAIISAPETRSSSPVRIIRNDEMQSISANGLYPCGEGAGYAGGIVSAAVDGIKAAEMIIK